jgi:alkylation response protein AidB-like acyl-CoA dehydrogenase
MDISLTTDQLDLAQNVRHFLARTHGPQVLRRLDAGTGRDPAIWKGLVDMGLTGAAVPAGLGGLGLGLVEAALMAAECGRVALAEPLVDTAFIAAPLLAGSPANGDALAKIAAGHVKIAVPHGINPWVADLAGASHVLTEDNGIFSLQPGTPTPSLESVDPLRRLSPAPDTASKSNALLNHAALMTAAQLCGLADAMLEQTTAYAKLRQQFGQPIGAFQAVKHSLASAMVAIEFAKPVVWRAAASLQAGAPFAGVAVSHAKIAAGDAAWAMTETAMQIHGAMGYTYEVDLHFWMKRSWALAAAWGDRAFHLAQVDAAVIGGAMPIGAEHGFV